LPLLLLLLLGDMREITWQGCALDIDWFVDGCFFSVRTKLQRIARLTIEHSRLLAIFSFTYKILLALQIHGNGGKECSWHAFVAGFVPGFFVFGNNQSTVGKQVRNKTDSILFSKVTNSLTCGRC
jgi:hypothetical protein